MRHKENLFGYECCALVVLALAGCAHEEAGLPDVSFGNSVGQNLAAQIVNPDGPTGQEPLVLEGNRAAIGQGRYMGDAVEAPREISASGVGGGGGGGGGGGAQVSLVGHHG